MILWTLQPMDVWNQLQAETILYADPLLGGNIDLEWPEPHKLEDNDFYQHYNWIREQMTKRIPNYQGRFPWWAWREWSSTHPKPDLRSEKRYWKEDGVRLELEIPDELVLLSDYDGWHCVLNHWYCGFTQEEMDAWDAEMTARRNPNNYTEDQLTEGWKKFRKGEDSPYRLEPVPEDMTARIRLSWENCLDLEFMHTSPYWQCGSEPSWATQACFEELRLDQVRDVTKFKASTRKCDP